MRLALLVVVVGCGGGGSGKSPDPPPANRGSGSEVPPASSGSAKQCACQPDEQCVQRFDGMCGIRDVICIKRSAACPADPGLTCSPACEAAYCPRPFQCSYRPPCGTEIRDAFTCYGH
jgi:hypothetical protein